MKKLNIAYLEILDWGASCAGEHYYGVLKFKDNNKKVELQEKLTAKMAKYLNEKDDYLSYKKGDSTKRFSSLESVIKEAIQVCKKDYPHVDLILHGSSASMSIQEALWGDKKIVKRINELYAEAENIVWYSNTRFPNKGQDDRMEEIDKEFNELIGEKDAKSIH